MMVKSEVVLPVTLLATTHEAAGGEGRFQPCAQGDVRVHGARMDPEASETDSL